MKTTHPHLPDLKKAEKWYLIDAEGKVLGRLAAEIAMLLRGKNKPIFHPSVICGDQVVVINAEKIAVTGKKETDKTYITFSGYPGGLKTTPLAAMRAKKPEKILELAVKGMIPRNRLRKMIMERLYVYSGSKHPHTQQNPQLLTFK